MRIFITGASGYIGSHVAARLIACGYTVAALSRSASSDKQLRKLGAHALRGSLGDHTTLRRAAAESDGVIHTAFDYGTPEGIAVAFRVDQEATMVMSNALLGTGRPLVYTSGAGIIGDTGKAPAPEHVIPHPLPIARLRAEVERHVIALVGVRGIVIRPGLVYGDGGGVLTGFIRLAREQTVPRTIGSGENAWSSVHVEDLAELYKLALEKAPAGSILHAASGPPVTMREMVSAISTGVGKGGKTELWEVEDARRKFAWVEGVILEQRISSVLTQRLLGWQPRKSSVLEELRYGSYQKAFDEPN